MSGWVLVAMGVVVTAMDVIVAMFLLRRPAGPGAGQLHAAGRAMLLLAPIPFFTLVGLGFGLFGDVAGIETISLHGSGR